MSEREKSSSKKFSVMDDTCRHEVLLLVWGKRMTNHAAEVSAGEIFSASGCVRVFVSTVSIVSYHVQAFYTTVVVKKKTKGELIITCQL